MKIILGTHEIELIQPGVNFITVILKDGSRLEFPAGSRIETKSAMETRPKEGLTKADVDILAKTFQMQHKIPTEGIDSVRYRGDVGGFDQYHYGWVEITDKGRYSEPTPESVSGGLGTDGAGISETKQSTSGVVVGLERPVTVHQSDRMTDVYTRVGRDGRSG